MSKSFRNTWDSLGKIFRGRQDEIPLGMDYCEMCGRILPSDELHHVIGFFGRGRETLILCEECIEKPPSEWRKNFIYKRHET